MHHWHVFFLVGWVGLLVALSVTRHPPYPQGQPATSTTLQAQPIVVAGAQ